MKSILLKLFAIAALFAGFHLGMAPWIRSYGFLRNPRARLLDGVPPRDCTVALLGDSVFTSSCIDREDQTLWKQVEARTGRRVYPGALDGAKSLDILQGAFYLSRVMPRGSVVFVDVIPFRDWEERTRDFQFQLSQITGPYDPREPEWLLPRLDHALHLLLAPYNVTSMDLKNLPLDIRTARDPERLARVLRANWSTPPNIDRIWSRDGDFARERFSRFAASGKYQRRLDQFGNLDRLAATLAGRGITPVFVLTPFCEDLVHAWGGPREAAMLAGFERYRQDLRGHLASRGLRCLDLHGRVPGAGFADCFHTNALGDGIIAQAIADELTSAGPAS